MSGTLRRVRLLGSIVRAGASSAWRRGAVTQVPSGTVTFLFTDLEKSTRLWEDEPDAMQSALARHDALLRATIESHRGHIVKTTGDGFHAAFASARDAVDAAIDAQRALASQSWPATGPLRVRMGIHTGESEFRDGDYYGPAVNRAARMSSSAHGGQIVVSHTTEELVRDQLPQDVTLRDLGEHRFRDLTRPERVFQLLAPGLETDFAPLRSVDSRFGNLPVPRDRFIGRAREVAQVVAALEEFPLVTLTGVGGVGKTRLALQVATDTNADYADGAWLVELAGVGNEHLFDDAVD